MPVEIRELVIRAVLAEPRKRDGDLDNRNDSDMQKAALIDECVRQILKILKKSGEK